MANNNYHKLVEKLNQFIRKYYKNLLLRGFIYSIGLLFLFFVSVTLLEYYAHFNIAVRTVLFYSFLLTSFFILIKYIAIPFLGLYRLGATLSYEQAAAIIGNHFSDVRDKLLNVLQLQQLSSGNEAALQHSDLLNASIEQKIKELKPVPFTSAVDLSENKISSLENFTSFFLPNLLQIELKNNKISQIPLNFGINWTLLDSFFAGNNLISSLPATFGTKKKFRTKKRILLNF